MVYSKSSNIPEDFFIKSKDHFAIIKPPVIPIIESSLTQPKYLQVTMQLLQEQRSLHPQEYVNMPL